MERSGQKALGKGRFAQAEMPAGPSMPGNAPLLSKSKSHALRRARRVSILIGGGRQAPQNTLAGWGVEGGWEGGKAARSVPAPEREAGWGAVLSRAGRAEETAAAGVRR